jgi:hypothetical protein
MMRPIGVRLPSKPVPLSEPSADLEVVLAENASFPAR